MATIFSKIVAGEIPSYKVAEDDKFYAFLDINPLVKGHTLVVPKKEVDYIYDLSDEELAAILKNYPGNIPVILHYQDSNQTIQAQRIFVQKSEEMQEKLAGISLKTVFR